MADRLASQALQAEKAGIKASEERISGSRSTSTGGACSETCNDMLVSVSIVRLEKEDLPYKVSRPGICKPHIAVMDFEKNEVRHDEGLAQVGIPFRTDGGDNSVEVAPVRLVGYTRLSRSTVTPVPVAVAAPDGEEGICHPDDHPWICSDGGNGDD
ncbi:unnamed protein product [Phytophthora fragariaefolia]|uniref:Unnamed protein product n=1 Tax=Phytophthora fragariaefolia TaxID=1490495 RepID=A0A9W7CRX1_9STRA|nr:unnamed protein product [Phytophthora fragariaefolia]